MSIIRYSSEELKNRANELRQLQSRYEHCQGELTHIMRELQEIYLVEGKSIILEEMDLSSFLNETAIKLNKLAYLLDERANQIEDESLHSKE